MSIVGGKLSSLTSSTWGKRETVSRSARPPRASSRSLSLRSAALSLAWHARRSFAAMRASTNRRQRPVRVRALDDGARSRSSPTAHAAYSSLSAMSRGGRRTTSGLVFLLRLLLLAADGAVARELLAALGVGEPTVSERSGRSTAAR